MANDCCFQHDNDPKHTACIRTNCLDQKRLQPLKWPFFLHLIEDLWDEVERRMKKRTSEERKRFARVSHSSLEWNREATLEKASSFACKPTK